jgi:proline iminopeptidase
VRFYNPDNANRLLSEPGSRNLELYPVFCGADVDFIIGGQLFAVPDFRPRLKDIEAPMLVLAGRYDRALHPSMQQQFADFAPRAKLQFLERSGSFGHIEEPEAVFDALRTFWSAAG